MSNLTGLHEGVCGVKVLVAQTKETTVRNDEPLAKPSRQETHSPELLRPKHKVRRPSRSSKLHAVTTTRDDGQKPSTILYHHPAPQYVV